MTEKGESNLSALPALVLPFCPLLVLSSFSMKYVVEAMLAFVCCVLPVSVFAASGESLPLSAVIRGPAQMVAGHTAIFNASSSKLTSGTVTYTWYQDDIKKPISTASEAFFLPNDPGTYSIRLIVKSENAGEIRETTTTFPVHVYKRKVALIADTSQSDSDIEAWQKLAESGSVFLTVIRPNVSTRALAGQTTFAQAVSEQFPQFVDSDAIIIATEPPLLGMQALVKAGNNDEERLGVIAGQSIVVISKGSLSTISRTIRGPYSLLNPERLFLTRPEAISMVLEASSMQQFEAQILKNNTEVIVQSNVKQELRPWNVFSVMVTYLLKRGIPSQTVILLLLLPIIALILAFFKQVIGMTTYGLYTPSIIALSFLTLGWLPGLAFLILIVGCSYGIRRLMRKWRMLHVPKMAIVLGAVSIVLLLTVSLAAWARVVLSADTVFVLLVMSTLSESLLATSIEEGWKTAISGIVETIVAALLCVFIVRWNIVQSYVLAYPEILLLTFPLNIMLGRYSGLRLTEYFRFRQLFSHLQEE